MKSIKENIHRKCFRNCRLELFNMLHHNNASKKACSISVYSVRNFSLFALVHVIYFFSHKSLTPAHYCFFFRRLVQFIFIFLSFAEQSLCPIAYLKFSNSLNADGQHKRKGMLQVLGVFIDCALQWCSFTRTKQDWSLQFDRTHGHFW